MGLAAACLGMGVSDAKQPDPGLFERSVHAPLGCAACHAESGAGKGEAVHCETCHAEPLERLRAGRHGRAILGRFGSAALACAACHGDAHRIVPAREDGSAINRIRQPDTCGACHGDRGQAALLPDGRTALESYRLSVHGEALARGNRKAAACSDCHGSHDVRPPGNPLSRVSRAHVSATCGHCHRAEQSQFQASVHGRALSRGEREAPSCVDCHGEHTIRSPKEPGSSVFRAAVTRTCSGCHASERIASKFGVPADRLRTFLDSYHGLAGSSGDLRVANCASCHGWHDVLPAADPGSRVHPARLAATCAQCHPHASLGLSMGKVHKSLSRSGEGSRPAALLRRLYLLLIPIVLAAMLFHNLADILRKALPGKPRPLKEPAGEEPLLSPGERTQHGLLALSFAALAVTGFALEFPWLWASLGLSRLAGESGRLVLHRGAALLFLALGAYHLGYLLFNPRGRRLLKSLLPARRDLLDPWRILAFNLGLSGERPALERWSYVEKAEYWALLWGSAVMIASGAILIFHNFMLAHFPLWVIESSRVVHWMEAVLACASIAAWHLYWVMFDPEIYPMNWAWLTGRRRLKAGGGESDGE